jgi:phage baseplate assembly protein W
MAIIVQNRFPIDSIDRKAVGVDIPFNAPGVFKSNYTTREAVKNNLLNFFSTDQGERVFNPFFGCGLKRLIFENMDSLTSDYIKKILSDEISQYFPFVGIAQLDVNLNEDSNTVNITIKYQVTNFGIQDEINIII